MRIKVIGHNGKIFLQPLADNPWNSFFEELKKSGAQIVTNDSGAKFDVLIANNHSKKSIRDCEKFGVTKQNRILILWEPEEINGQLYRESTLNKYGHIFTPSHDWISGKNIHKFNWPQGKAISKNQTDREWLKRNKKFVLIASNKYSISKGELYSLRRSVLKNVRFNKSIDLFGYDWNRSIFFDIRSILSSAFRVNFREYSIKSIKLSTRKFTNYQGISTSKQTTLTNYKFALVIENSNNYISEKLFESLNSQCIVLYVGADLTKNLNRNIAIQAKADLDNISKKINQILNLSPGEQLSLMKTQRKEYLKVNDDWHNYKVLKKLARDSVNLLNF